MLPTLVLTKYAPVEDRELTAIQVTGEPDKTSYKLGEAFDSAGLEVTAVYSDGSEEVIDPADWRLQVLIPVSQRPDTYSILWRKNRGL